MGFSSGTAQVSDEPTRVCSVPENGVRIRNRGSSVVYFGDESVSNTSGATGYPLEPGESETFAGARAKESPVVPAPPGDTDPPDLWARCDEGSSSEVSWISVAML